MAWKALISFQAISFSGGSFLKSLKKPRLTDFPELGCGLGLRTEYYSHIFEHTPRSISWFEAISENYMGIGGKAPGRALRHLEKIRQDYPVALHGVSLSIGSVDPLNRAYLKELRELIHRIEPAWFSDHLCWTGVDGQHMHDLMPLPYTEQTIRHLVDRIRRVQDFMGRRMLVENVSSYLEYSVSEMQEWEFLSEIANRADCGILLDVNNIYVSSRNHGFEPAAYLSGVPAHRVGQMHLAGHTDNGDHLIDTHDEPVSEEVWAVYDQALELLGPVTSMLERDDNFPDFSELELEVERARIAQAAHAGPSAERRSDEGAKPARPHPAHP